MEADEELRNLLRSAESILKSSTSKNVSGSVPGNKQSAASVQTARKSFLAQPEKAKTAVNEGKMFSGVASSNDSKDLSSLLDSLNEDLKSELQIANLSSQASKSTALPIPSRPLNRISDTIAHNKSPSPASSFSIASLNESDTNIEGDSAFDADSIADGDDSEISDNVTVVKFGKEYSLRGKHGLYLTAVPTSIRADKEASLQPTSTHFVLGSEGQGVGDKLDCLQFINLNKKYASN